MAELPRTTSLNGRLPIGTGDILFITLDTLRFDVAVEAAARGLTPNLVSLMPCRQWEERHTPGSFTWSAHHAFFSGFLPTPVTPGRHPRLFASRFAGSETSTEQTFVFDAPDVVSGLRQSGYYSICLGGVGFFNRQSPLSCVFPDLFDESHWSDETGVTCRDSTENQIRIAVTRITELPQETRVFLFLNVAALHQPNCLYLAGATEDSVESQIAALAYVDSCLPPLFHALSARSDTACIICSDHGTTYGEDGYTGHRLAHPHVWTVPYTEFLLRQGGAVEDL